MKIWAVANQKGGVGKTTTTVSLAGALAERGERVLMLDLDPHGSLTTYFKLNPDEIEQTIYDLFTSDALSKPLVSSLIRQTGIPTLDFIPSSTLLATIERRMVAKDGMGLVIKNTLTHITGYDHVLLDCPPVLGMLMINALAACDQLIIPVQTEFLAIQGLERMLHTLEMLNKSRNPKIRSIVIPTMFDRRTQASLQAYRQLKKDYDSILWEHTIPVDTKFRDASKAGQPINVYDKNTRGTKAYERLMLSLLALDTQSNDKA